MIIGTQDNTRNDGEGGGEGNKSPVHKQPGFIGSRV